MLALLLALTDCGLEKLVQLEPPVAAIAPGTDTFSFQATSANSELQFLGFEVYYRIYAVGDSVPTYFNSIEELTAASFKRLYDPKWAPGDPEYTPPLIAPNASAYGTSYQITIGFNVAASIYPQISSLGLAPAILIPAARRAIAGLSEYKRFVISEFVSGEADFAPSAWDSINASEDVTVVMFALSYGFDTTKLSPVYSNPVLIGIEDLTIPDYSA